MSSGGGGMDAALLRRLGGALAPGLPAAVGGSARAPDDPGAPDFARLLQRAGAGAERSGLPVVTAPGSNLDLSTEDLERLSVLADRAEASGITRALAILDGKAVVLDVESRTVLREADLSAGPVTGVDGVVAWSGGAGGGTLGLRLPGGAVGPEIARALGISAPAET